VRPDLLFHNYCSVCHGDRGDGRSRARGSLNPPPTDFTSAQPDVLSRARMILALQHGRPGTAMTAWTTQLSQKEIEAVVDYVRATMMPPEPGTPLAKGRALYLQNCAGCHGDRGQGVASSPAHPAPRPFQGTTARGAMIAAVKEGQFGRLSHGFAGRLKADEIENTIDYVRTSLAPSLAPGVSGTRAHGGRGGDAAPALDQAAPLPNGLSGNAERGERLYQQNCVACHGPKGDGNGPRTAQAGGKPRPFGAAPMNRPALYGAIAEGKTGTDMPAWRSVLARQPLADLAEYVWRTWYAPAQGAKAK
jgi:mono/diheme cytochrome c family protein